MLISYGQDRGIARPLMPVMRSPAMWVSGKRPVAMTLLLEPTVKETLAKLGKSTRFNLGYYRRRLQAAEPCEFVDNAGNFLQEHELEGLNRTSLNPIDPGRVSPAIRMRLQASRRVSAGPAQPPRQMAEPDWRLAAGERDGAALADECSRIREVFTSALPCAPTSWNTKWSAARRSWSITEARRIRWETPSSAKK